MEALSHKYLKGHKNTLWFVHLESKTGQVKHQAGTRDRKRHKDRAFLLDLLGLTAKRVPVPKVSLSPLPLFPLLSAALQKQGRHLSQVSPHQLTSLTQFPPNTDPEMP